MREWEGCWNNRWTIAGTGAGAGAAGCGGLEEVKRNGQNRRRKRKERNEVVAQNRSRGMKVVVRIVK